MEASPRGTYLRISEALRRDIEGGKITDPLPSEAELMRSYGIGRNTVRRALKALEADGIVASRPGVGWHVQGQADARPLVTRMTTLIADERLAVGDPYPSEAKLCERFGASRTAVRHALAQMEGSGLLDTRHGKGRTVRALPAAETGQQ